MVMKREVRVRGFERTDDSLRIGESLRPKQHIHRHSAVSG
jgi:hypothetical protein